MNCLIKSCQIWDTDSPWHHQLVNLYIEKGIIQKILPITELPTTASDTIIIEANGKKLSIGWIDMRVLIPDPGLEHKETLLSGAEAAQEGGFTEILLLPNTQPVIQHKSNLAYIQHHNQHQLVKMHPTAAVTLETEGRELTEMIDLYKAGAVAFTDGIKPVWHSDILVKSLQYLQFFDGLLINRPEDTLLTRFGQMHEGKHSTSLGLKGLPALAEEMMIQRDLQFLEYSGGKIHFSLISSARSVRLVREAKQKGLQVTCDIAAHQLAFTDADLLGFDTFLKVNPPFRSLNDQEALWEGLADDTIDAVVSDHCPQDEESKKLEFDLADFGVIGLQTTFSVLYTQNLKRGEKALPLEKILEKITHKPRQILKLPIPKIAEGEAANLTLFDTEKTWVLQEKDIRSHSKNSPFIGQTLQGKSLAVIHQNQLYQNA
jgi:dihydroorotase